MKKKRFRKVSTILAICILTACMPVGVQYRITVGADDSFLGDADTVYPVTIDPTITVSNELTGAGAIEDSILFSAYPRYNYGAFLFNSIGTTQASYGTARTVVKLTGLINSAEYQSLPAERIKSVKFVATEASGRPAQLIHLYPLTENTTWTESTITWNNAGAYSTALDCADYMTDSQKTEFDITPLVRAWKAGTYPADAGFIMINDDETA